MENKMRNTVAFVTGGASGMGKAIVSRIIHHGGRVFFIDLNPAGKEFAEECGPRAKFIVADVSSEEEVKQALNVTLKTFGKINVVINAAGIAVACEPYDFHQNTPHSLDLLKKVMNVNVIGTFNVATKAAGLMAANEPDEYGKRGVIINVSSIVIYDSPGCFAAYAATKAAIAGMTMPFARNFGTKGIRVVGIAPGIIDTPLAADFGENIKCEFVTPTEMDKSQVRIGKPDEIAHVMQCIIENPFINATMLPVDGGYRLIRSFPK